MKSVDVEQALLDVLAARKDMVPADQQQRAAWLSGLKGLLGGLTPEQYQIFKALYTTQPAGDSKEALLARADAALSDLWRARIGRANSDPGCISYCCDDWRIVSACRACFSGTWELWSDHSRCESEVRSRWRRAYVHAQPEKNYPHLIIARDEGCAWWFIGTPTPDGWAEMASLFRHWHLRAEQLQFLNYRMSEAELFERFGLKFTPKPEGRPCTEAEWQAFLAEMNKLCGVMK